MSVDPGGPPRLARGLLRLLLPEDLRGQVLADMAAGHARIRRDRGGGAAARWYRRQVVGSLRPALAARLHRLAPRGRRPDACGRRFTHRRPARLPTQFPTEGQDILSQLLLDLRFGARWMRLNPGVTATILATLALGIGASTVVFSVVHGVLLAPLPYPNADRIVRVYDTDPETHQGRQNLSLVEAVDYGAADSPLERLLPFDTYSVTLQGPDQSYRLRATFAPAGFFRIFGSRPLLGRTFLPEEDAPGRDDVVVLSAGLWRRLFGAAADVLGRRIIVEGASRTVVGVMPADFDFYPGTDLWVPLALDPSTLTADEVLSHGTPAIGLLPVGVSVDSTREALDAVARNVLARYPRHEDVHGILLVGLRDWLTGSSRPVLVALLGAVVFLLLLATANVASLLLARAEKRQQELAVRAALGAGRGRLARQMLVESVLLSGSGGALGVALAYALRGAVVAAIGDAVPRADAIAVNLPVLAFAAAVTLVTGIVFGLAPALQTGNPAAVLHEGARSSTGRGRHRFRLALVALESAIVVALLLGATLVTRSLVDLTSVDSGLAEEGTLTFELSLPESAYGGPVEIRSFFEELVGRLERLPGVRAAGAVSWLPFARTPSDWPVSVEGRELPEELRGPDYSFMVGDYLEAAGIELIRGRRPDPDDTGFEAVITRSMAEVFFGDQEPLGRRFRQATSDRWLTVVGIVEDHRLRSLGDDPRPGFYFRYRPLEYGSNWYPRSMGVVLRADADALALAPLVREQVRALDPTLPVERLQSLSEVVRATVATPRFTAAVMSGFASLGLLLGAVGVFGVVSYSVAERTREIGIRMALGAARGRVLAAVLLGSLVPVAVGGLVGLGAGILLARETLGDLLFGVDAADPGSGLLVVFILLGAALAAAAGPSVQATRVDPMSALRDPGWGAR